MVNGKAWSDSRTPGAESSVGAGSGKRVCKTVLRKEDDNDNMSRGHSQRILKIEKERGKVSTWGFTECVGTKVQVVWDDLSLISHISLLVTDMKESRA